MLTSKLTAINQCKGDMYVCPLTREITYYMRHYTQNPVNGAYRDLRQYLSMLAKFCLSENSKESLKGFAELTGTFQIALAHSREFVCDFCFGS